MTFSKAQTQQLLAPIKPVRVLKDGKNHSHVSQQDVTAHLIRVFGFGNFSTEIIDLTMLFEECRNPDSSYRDQRWDVGYRCAMRLTIYSDHGEEERSIICSYEDSSTGDAQNQVRHDAHDLAMKSAISLAKKRCCINLGDQFGLSLYNKGQMTALVKGTLVLPPDFYDEGEKQDVDLQDVEQQQSMGHDETEKVTEPTEEQAKNLAQSVGVKTSESEVPATTEEVAEALGATEVTTEYTPEEMATRRKEMFALFNEAGFEQRNSDQARADRLGYCASVLDHEVATSTDLTHEELVKVIAALRSVIDSEKAGSK
jgi:recombination DNA repair RAD52 pathway protein